MRRGAVRHRLPDRPAACCHAAVGEASFNYSFGWVRFVHFVAAYVFFFNFVFRIYWGFVGQPVRRAGRTSSRWTGTRCSASGARPSRSGRSTSCRRTIEPVESIGHNALAGWTYFMTFLAFLFQCVTGFGLYAAMSDGLAADSCSPGSCR